MEILMKRKTISKAVRLEVFKKCNGHCAYCGCILEYKDMQVDHVIPLNGWSEQGVDSFENMLPACRSCNHYKSRSTLENFRKMIEAMPDTLMRDSVTYKNAVRFGLVIPNKHPIKFYFEKDMEKEEDWKSKMCDQYCRYPRECVSDEELDDKCEKCPMAIIFG